MCGINQKVQRDSKMDLEKMTALELAEKIKQRQISVLDGVKTVFAAIEKKGKPDTRLS